MDDRTSSSAPPLGTSPVSGRTESGDARGAPDGAGSQRAPADQAKGRKAEAAGDSSGGIKETIESILVAFILAFIFRAFIVEAFVIPTGSMAPTLLGAHLRFDCDDCGYAFAANYSARQSGDDLIVPSRAGPEYHERRDPLGNRQLVRYDKVYDAHCPNCGFKMPRSQAVNPPVYYGDRILVLKYLYLFQDPDRWDVVVFKSPDNAPQYVQNYIKRLVGLPGESLMVLDGDVYTADGHTADQDAFRIQTKPDHVQQALWRVVYDNDHHPRGLQRPGPAWRQPWAVAHGRGWDLDGRVFRFNNGDGASSIYFNPDANPRTNAFTDWMGYNIEAPWHPAPVSDLKLDLYYHRTEGDGPLRLKLTKRDDTFVAELTPTEARLYREARIDSGGSVSRTQIGQAVPLRDGNAPIHVEFSNVDYQVTLRLDGRDVLQTSPGDYAPNVRRLLDEAALDREAPPPAVQIEAERQRAALAHVGLWRDIYYTTRAANGRSNGGGGGSAWWGTPERIVQLNAGEYFVLGDNSVISGDARYWQDPIDLPAEDLLVESGRVPERFMLGKAFFVYWPAGYQIGDSGPAILPNFGDMRFIR